MTEMIERVRFAVFKAIAGQPGAIITVDAAERAARAAIEAMREPILRVIDAAVWDHQDKMIGRGGVLNIWTDMIDAALAPTPT